MWREDIRGFVDVQGDIFGGVAGGGEVKERF